MIISTTFVNQGGYMLICCREIGAVAFLLIMTPFPQALEPPQNPDH
jgi:hypothetical protein